MHLEFTEPVLLVEDTPSLSMAYRSALERAGLTVRPASRIGEARAALAQRDSRVVLLDMMLPDGNGLDLLREIRARSPQTKVVVITANGSINRAVEAMRGGAFDFLVKPFDERRLLGAVRSAISALSADAEEAEVAESASSGPAAFGGFLGSSLAMRRIYAMIRNIGRSTATVFIVGESGTGKEIAAQAIHRQSTRRAGPFVAINCGAIPRDLLESEVFGHLKGSFTGAIADKPGAAAAADRGTLFLDEICEMDPGLQTKLLRFLQTSTIQPVGAVEPRKVDVRIICATNRDPAAEVRAGRFREDLFYRLHVVPMVMPPLRERGDDVLEIAGVLLAQMAQEEGKRFRRISAPVREAFRAYHWPGNVRELGNVLRNAVVLNDGEELTLDMLPAAIWQGQTPGEPRHSGPADLRSGGSVTVGRFATRNPAVAARSDAEHLAATLRALVGRPLSEIEREYIEVTISACDGSVPRAARLLDVSPSTLYRKRDAWEEAAS